MLIPRALPPRRFVRRAYQSARTTQTRNVASQATQKREGTIADAFASLSGQKFEPLEPRFATIKQNLIHGHEDAICASWVRLLDRLRTETKTIAQLGSASIPSINFADLASPSTAFNDEYRKRGVAIVRGVLPEHEALNLKSSVQQYIRTNPHTKAFPPADPQVYELYWSPAQVRARAHPHMLSTYRFLLSYWHTDDPSALISNEPILYADRLRIRLPGDAQFALGPHIDGGGPERWEPTGYGRGDPYGAVFRGQWEHYDPWESSRRLPVESDLYAGVGACSAFRMSQGWLAMSYTSPGEGTLLVNPLLALTTAYVLLRPFFAPKTAPFGLMDGKSTEDELMDEEFLRADNWALEIPASSWLQGATPGKGQELSPTLHPHLRLGQTMVHVPKVAPGDFVAWHCDTIHAVDKVHAGKSDSSVMYIPACPLTERNAKYLARQRETFLRGVPAPDFPGGEGESRHVGRPSISDVAMVTNEPGMRAFGLKRWDSGQRNLSVGEQKMLAAANEILEFSN